MSTVTERVAAGVAFLDEHDPDWWRADVERAINLDTLKLRRAEDCILGQRCPAETLARYIGTDDEDELSEYSYEAFEAYAVSLSGLETYGLNDWARTLAFMAYDGEWEDLTAEWKRIITERRATS